MLTHMDHLVILVRDLERASEDYRSRGFNVVPGGEHADNLTHNALIPFQDEGYLELVAFLDSEDPRDNVWGWRSFAGSGAGLIDYCLASDDLEKDVEHFREQDLPVAGPDEGGRRLPDERGIRWRIARFEQLGKVLPFLIEDLTDRSLRVPGAPATEHPNGTTGISGLTLAVPELASSATLLGALVEGTTRPSPAEAQPARFKVGVQTLTLTAPESSTGPVQKRLETAGPGPLAVTLKRNGEDVPLDQHLAHA